MTQAPHAYYVQWLSGYRAAKAGQQKEDNPYPLMSMEWNYWNHGWTDYMEQREEQ